MNNYHQSDPELTAEEKLLGELFELDQRIPIGFQLGIPRRLDKTIAAVEKLFSEHKLPLKEELLTELAAWREHAEQGQKYAEACDRLMQKVIGLVQKAAENQLGRPLRVCPASRSADQHH